MSRPAPASLGPARSILYASIAFALAVFLVVAAEFGLRLLFPYEVRTAPDSLAYAFHPDYLVSLEPNVEKTFETKWGDVVHWRTNGHGFRGGELRDSAELRVIVYGDSNIQARFTELEHTFASRLERELQRLTGKDVEILNAGVVGFGPDQSLLRFREEAQRYAPDVVIFHVFADNDFGDIVRNRLFELDPTGRLVETTFERQPDQEIATTRVHRLRTFFFSLLVVRAPLRIWRKLTVNDPLEDFVALTALEYVVYEESAPRSFSCFADHYDYDLALFPDSESARTKVELMSAVLTRGKALADEWGIAFLVVIQPSSRDLTTNLSINYENLSRHPAYRPTNLSSAVEGILVQNRIHGINLFEAFADNGPENLVFKFGDDHWTDAGQALAARRTARYIYESFPALMQ